MKIEYVAFDGTRFDSKDLCNIYEKNKEAEFIKTKRLAFWSASGDGLNAENIGSAKILCLNDEEGGRYFIRASAIFIKDDEVLSYIRSTYTEINECGFYFWDEVDKWISAKKIKKQCRDTLDRINELEREWKSPSLEDLDQNSFLVQSVNLSKIWNGVDPTLKDELMIDDDGIVYPF